MSSSASGRRARTPAWFGRAPISLAAALLALATAVDAQIAAAQGLSIRILADPPCGQHCPVTLTRSARLVDHAEGRLGRMPRVDARDRRGRIYVVNYRNGSPVGPPLVFDRNGRFVAALGRFGSGFGATSMPSWIDAGWDDTTRVYDRGRVVVFGPDQRPVRSLERADLPRGARDVVGYPHGGLAALSSLPAPAGEPFAVFLLGRGRTSSAVLPPLGTPALDGPHRRIARVREAGAERLWVAQFALSRGHGYDLLQVDTSGRVHSAVRRRPGWWVSADLAAFTQDPMPSSRVVGIREIAEGVVAILIAQPKPDWERVGVERGTMAGWWNRYDGRIEIVDVRRGAVLGSTHVCGMPLRILDDTTIVTYSEDERATPSVELWHVSVR